MSSEETRMKELNSFDPRIESQRQINSDNILHFFINIQLINETVVLFKSIETLSTKVVADFSRIIVDNMKEKILTQSPTTELRPQKNFECFESIGSNKYTPGASCKG